MMPRDCAVESDRTCAVYTAVPSFVRLHAIIHLQEVAADDFDRLMVFANHGTRNTNRILE